MFDVNFFILVAFENPGLGDEGPDSWVCPEYRKMKGWLDEEKVLLLRAPPGSGKTSFGVCFGDYLRQHGSSAYYINAARFNNQVTKHRSVWKDVFGLILWEAVGDDSIYIIMDEAQTWYPANVPEEVKDQLDRFWGGIKSGFKPRQEWTNHVGLGFINLRFTTGIRLLCLAGYGEANIGGHATPLEFIDPTDPDTQLRLPLGLNFLRLDRDKAHEVIAKYVNIKSSRGKMVFP